MLEGRRRRVLRAGAAVGLAAALAGCSATGSSGSSSSSNSVTAKGSDLVVYLSQPPSADPVQKQVLEAEQLACSQLAGNIPGTSLSVKCQTVADRLLSDNARTAIQDQSSIAYIGEIGPGTSEQTLGITNALDLPQVSPTDTAPILDSYYESASTYGHTFVRIAPSSAQEAQAVLAEMKKLGVHNLYVAGDGSDYGNALESAVRSGASSQGISVGSSETAVDAIFYAGNSASAAEHWAAGASSTATSTKLFLPSALAGLDFGAGNWSRFKAVYVSQPGVSAGADKSFVSEFSSHYGASPSSQAAFGYAAVQIVMHVLREAGKSANDRAKVLKDLHKVSDFDSAVGPISLASSGESSLGPGSFGFSRLRGGSLVALRSPAG